MAEGPTQSQATVHSEVFPSQAAVAAVYDHNILKQDGEVVKFSTLTKTEEASKNLVIFIRHFFCGSCQDYVRALANELPLAKLHELNASLCIVGPGDPSLVSKYIEETNCPFPIFANPTAKIYDQLGFSQSRGLAETKPDYIKQGFLSNMFGSMARGLGSGTKFLSGGKSSQNGGEVLWVDGELRFIHRMLNTQDHLEVRDLEALLKQ